MGFNSLFFVISSFSCGTRPSDQKRGVKIQAVNEREFAAATAPQWSDLFLRMPGWLGGDGIFSIPFSGNDSEKKDRVLLLFSDTMIGGIEEGQPKPDLKLVNNSVALLKSKHQIQ